MADDARTCPICRQAVIDRFRPFCSARCADVDLGRWFTESYAVPASGSADARVSAKDGAASDADEEA